MGKYRGKLEILADILQVVGTGARKTQIMYNANLSYRLLCKYLRDALGEELIRSENDGYVVTDKGFRFLSDFDSYTRRLKELETQLADAETERVFLEKCISNGTTGTTQGILAGANSSSWTAVPLSLQPSPLKGVILAAGDGKRISSVTYGAFPKELLPIGNVPTIRFPLEALRLSGVKNFYVVVAPHTKHGIVDGLRSGHRFDVNVCYVVQDGGEMRGLGAAIASTRSWIGQEDFVVACGDTILCDLSASNPLDCLKPLMAVHKETNALATVLLHPTTADPSRFGLVKLENLKEKDGVLFGEIGGTVEKPSLDVAESFRANGYHYVIAGYYVFKPEIFSYLEKTLPGVNQEVQITDTLQLAVKSGEKVYGVTHARSNGTHLSPCEYWDVGVPEDYKNANKHLVDLNLDRLLE